MHDRKSQLSEIHPLLFSSLKSAEGVTLCCWAPPTWTMASQNQFVNSALCLATEASMCLLTSGAGRSSAFWGLCHGCTPSYWSWTARGTELWLFWATEPWREQRNGPFSRGRLSGQRRKTWISLRFGLLTLMCLQPPCASFRQTSGWEGLENVFFWWNLTPIQVKIGTYQSFFRGCLYSTSPLRPRPSWLSSHWRGHRGDQVERNGQGGNGLARMVGEQRLKRDQTCSGRQLHVNSLELIKTWRQSP